MAHKIMSSRYYNGAREGAPKPWHGIDYIRSLEAQGLEVAVAERPTTVTGILDLMDGKSGPVIINRRPMFYELEDGTRQSTNQVALVRQPTLDDPQTVYLGQASTDWVVMTPRDMAKMMDEIISDPLETFAFLERGGRMFACYKLPSIEVHTRTGNDPLESFLVVNNPMNGQGAAGAYVSHVRVVCNNTLQAAINTAVQSFRISHTPGAFKLMGRWIKDVYESTATTIEVMREAYEILAKTPVTDAQIKWIAGTIYPTPAKPRSDVPRKTAYADMLDYWKQQKERTDRCREKIYEFANSVETDYAGSSIEGTAWAAYNGVTRFETWRRGTTESMALNVFNGDRALRMRRAFNACMAIVDGKIADDIQEDTRVAIPLNR